MGKGKAIQSNQHGKAMDKHGNGLLLPTHPVRQGQKQLARLLLCIAIKAYVLAL